MELLIALEPAKPSLFPVQVVGTEALVSTGNREYFINFGATTQNQSNLVFYFDLPILFIWLLDKFFKIL